MAGFDNNVMYADNVDFTGSDNPSAKMIVNGQLIIGKTGSNPQINTLTPGANITITNGPGTITIASTGSGENTVSAGLGIDVQQSGSNYQVTNTGTIQYSTGIIDFKVVQDIYIFTTTSKIFVPSSFNFYCTTSNTPGIDGLYAFGFTAPTYSDSFGPNNVIFPSGAGSIFTGDTISGMQPITYPPNTDIYYSCPMGDSGTALTGILIIQGYYIQ